MASEFRAALARWFPRSREAQVREYIKDVRLFCDGVCSDTCIFLGLGIVSGVARFTNNQYDCLAWKELVNSRSRSGVEIPADVCRIAAIEVNYAAGATERAEVRPRPNVTCLLPT